MTDSYPSQLWKPRSVDDTQAMYSGWAATYEADVTTAGYATPARLAQDLVAAGAQGPILDFGCGTGLSGVAMRAAGLTDIDGCDINPDMIARIEARPEVRAAYRDVSIEEPNGFKVDPGAYTTIAAVGVVSLGAAPPETLETLVDHLSPGGLLAFSYNDATRVSDPYLQVLNRVLDGRCEQVSRSYGPHLPEKGMGSDIYVLRRL